MHRTFKNSFYRSQSLGELGSEKIIFLIKYAYKLRVALTFNSEALSEFKAHFPPHFVD
jgi:hypothetical protein